MSPSTLRSCVTFTLLAATANGYSQESPVAASTTPAEQDTFEEIVVTAQRREQALNDVGMSINVQSGEQLRNLGIANTSDLNKVVPALNVVPANTGFNGTPIYTLRGVGFNERSLSALASISVYQDEIPLAYPYMTAGPLLDIARVEVLKGPQGTLYGQNSTGGAINYIAERPTDTQRAASSRTDASIESKWKAM